MSDDKKEYTNGQLTVVWQTKKCIHSAKCVKSLPGVFNPHERPWINMEGADSEAIMKAIDKCPSGALSYVANDEEEGEAKNDVALQMLANGPIMVTGDFVLTDSEGKRIEAKKKVALCRCGASSNKPFCDGQHKKIGFEG